MLQEAREVVRALWLEDLSLVQDTCRYKMSSQRAGSSFNEGTFRLVGKIQWGDGRGGWCEKLRYWKLAEELFVFSEV